MADFQHRHYAHVAALLAGFQHTIENNSAETAMYLLRAGSRFLDAATGNPTNKDRSTARRRMGFACGETR